MSSTSTPSPEPSRTHRLTIDTSAARRMLHALACLGAAYGPADEQVIAEDFFNGHHIQVSLWQDEDTWALIVRGVPPLDAVVKLRSGEEQRVQGFDGAGEARFMGVVEASLTGGFELTMIVPSPPEM